MLATLTAGPFAGSAGAQDKSLYQRLGGYDAIAAVTDEFIGRLASDEQEKRFFIGFSTDSKMRIRQLIVDLICKSTGGPRLQRTRHEDGACRRRHHEIRLGPHAQNLRRGAQQIQSARKGAAGNCRIVDAAGEGHRREMTAAPARAAWRN
jgi:truncated hemoglobin YjbI